MKKIPLTQGQFAMVDDEDFEKLNVFKWYTLKTRNLYAARDTWFKNKKKCVLMHRIINKTPFGLITDHIDGNGLNNTKKNLRTCSHKQNLWNSKNNSLNKTGFKGVHLIKKTGKYRVNISINNRSIHLGCFKDINEAAKKYDETAIKLRGEYARLNFTERNFD